MKDLSILCGKNSDLTLDDILIVDNMIYSFAFNLENGIPILNYEGDKNDIEMIHVIKHLKHMKNFSNLRVENEKVYQLNMIYSSNIEDFIQYYDSSDSGDEDEDFDCDGITAYEFKTESGVSGVNDLQEKVNSKNNEIEDNSNSQASLSKLGSEFKYET